MRGSASVAIATVAATLLLPGAAGSSPSADRYGWPVEPFGASHPIRGTFGEPRTWFKGAPTSQVVDGGGGSFSFHQGVDIVAPDGTAVFPVRSGIVTRAARMTVVVSSGRQRFEYWHIVPSVERGARVEAYRTVLGRIRRSYGHVHLTEYDSGVPVDPLSSGHLTPYRDTVPPSVDRIVLRRAGTTKELLPQLVKGSIDVVAAASDHGGGTGIWSGMPIAPARVSWRLETTRDAAPVIRERIAFDAGSRLPANGSFWRSYARGTWQNMPTFHLHRYWRIPGTFVYRLGRIDTRALADGIYTLVVTARDARGNAATRSLTFLVWNRPGLPPPTPQG